MNYLEDKYLHYIAIAILIVVLMVGIVDGQAFETWRNGATL